MATKRLFAVAKMEAYITTLKFIQAIDLHDLAVLILKVLPAIPGEEYTDHQAAKLIGELDIWSEGSILITEYNLTTGKEIEWVKDKDEA